MNTGAVGDSAYRASAGAVESSRSAVSWAAVLAGGAVAIAVTMILLVLGSGLGFAAASPHPGEGVAAMTGATLAAIWLVVTQWLSSGLGGYVTGRLRTKWTNTHNDEVFFRDTAHGFLTWAVASVVIAMGVTSAGSALIGGAVDAGAKVATGAAQGAAGAVQAQAGSTLGAYDIDSLFRSAQPASGANAADGNAEAMRIVMRSLGEGGMSEADKSYLAAQIAARSGVSQEEAQRRIDDVTARVKAADAKVREAADAARKAAATTSILTALSLLIGAFIASVAGALGGRERDLHP